MNYDNLEVTKHAIDRYKERSGVKDLPDHYIVDRICTSIKKGKPVTHKNPALAACSLMNHRYQKASYFRHRGLIFVVVDNTVITVHNGQANHWK